MPSIDQLKILDSLDRTGSFLSAARSLRKSYTSVHYLVRTLEDRLGLKLVDRSQYRASLNESGKAVLIAGRELLQASMNLSTICETLRHGHEPRLHLIYDGVLNFAPIVRALNSVRKSNATTQVTINVAFHEEVEREFEMHSAHFMLVVTSPSHSHLPFIEFPPLKLFLVASRDHPLVRLGRTAKLTDLKRYPLVTVHGSSSKLGLSTKSVEEDSSFTVGDFFSKKMVIQKSLAYGWLPEYLIVDDLKAGVLKKIKSELSNEHFFIPKLFHRPKDTMGPASSKLIKALAQSFLSSP